MPEKDNYTTEVVFRADKSGDFKDVVFALFPYNFESAFNSNLVLSYQHVGQHSVADYTHCINTSRPVTEEEYQDLKQELESLGYNLEVVPKRNSQKVKELFSQFKNNR